MGSSGFPSGSPQKFMIIYTTSAEDFFLPLSPINVHWTQEGLSVKYIAQKSPPSWYLLGHE